jgi:hypothetical protein
MAVGTLGDSYIDTLLGEYLPVQQGPVEDVLSSETDQLLYALLLEQRARRMQNGATDIRTLLEQQRQATEQGTPEATGTYTSRDLELDPLATADDWQELDLDFVTSEVDLRFNDAIAVAFAPPTEEERVVQYDGSESPVTGLPVETSEIHLGAQEGTGGASVTVEAWR